MSDHVHCALVTGATRGIGQPICVALLDDARRRDIELAIAVACGGLDVLVSNAGIARGGPLATIDQESPI